MFCCHHSEYGLKSMINGTYKHTHKNNKYTLKSSLLYSSVIGNWTVTPTIMKCTVTKDYILLNLRMAK